MTPSRGDPARRPLRRVAVEILLAGGLGGGVGVLVGVLAGVLEDNRLDAPLLGFGAISGTLAGVLAVVTGREIVPRLVGFSFPARAALTFLTLAGGAFAATGLGFWLFPYYSVHALRSVILVASVNGLLALVAGELVFVYENLAARLSRTQELLARERLAQAEARERAARAELKALQARINPHFFFNALNTAAAFVSEDPSRAEVLLERFADLFRYAFRRGGEREVPLGEELRFIDDFLEIEKARFGDRLATRLEVEPGLANEPVPPLILQPLVENAVLHGRDAETGEGRVVIRARRSERGGLVLEVEDRGPGPGSLSGGALPAGHALGNIAARLAAAGAGRVELLPAPGGRGTLARVTLEPRAGRGEEEA
ncbi:MAG: hypothetical protein D6718_10560 [Acidobacteria bacterium]|nr:MAG: hypothetical protein D6718_10560 [Acidobacteriota bacterium]